jgi:hypothetical protein
MITSSYSCNLHILPDPHLNIMRLITSSETFKVTHTSVNFCPKKKILTLESSDVMVALTLCGRNHTILVELRSITFS